jgi:hypothetical protein
MAAPIPEITDTSLTVYVDEQNGKSTRCADKKKSYPPNRQWRLTGL